ncbi:hypothetical protein M422DRAFT_41067 [Sphaerobolus stellatus SS14]|nr:hypothetical protein M422DRAFT_41067 [Sphaerobolus stellatus SS14]
MSIPLTQTRHFGADRASNNKADSSPGTANPNPNSDLPNEAENSAPSELDEMVGSSLETPAHSSDSPNSDENVSSSSELGAQILGNQPEGAIELELDSEVQATAKRIAEETRQQLDRELALEGTHALEGTQDAQPHYPEFDFDFLESPVPEQDKYIPPPDIEEFEEVDFNRKEEREQEQEQQLAPPELSLSESESDFDLGVSPYLDLANDTLAPDFPTQAPPDPYSYTSDDSPDSELHPTQASSWSSTPSSLLNIFDSLPSEFQPQPEALRSYKAHASTAHRLELARAKQLSSLLAAKRPALRAQKLATLRTEARALLKYSEGVAPLPRVSTTEPDIGQEGLGRKLTLDRLPNILDLAAARHKAPLQRGQLYYAPSTSKELDAEEIDEADFDLDPQDLPKVDPRSLGPLLQLRRVARQELKTFEPPGPSVQLRRAPRRLRGLERRPGRSLYIHPDRRGIERVESQPQVQVQAESKSAEVEQQAQTPRPPHRLRLVGLTRYPGRSSLFIYPANRKPEGQAQREDEMPMRKKDQSRVQGTKGHRAPPPPPAPQILKETETGIKQQMAIAFERRPGRSFQVYPHWEHTKDKEKEKGNEVLSSAGSSLNYLSPRRTPQRQPQSGSEISRELAEPNPTRGTLPFDLECVNPSQDPAPAPTPTPAPTHSFSESPENPPLSSSSSSPSTPADSEPENTPYLSLEIAYSGRRSRQFRTVSLTAPIPRTSIADFALWPHTKAMLLALVVHGTMHGRVPSPERRMALKSERMRKRAGRGDYGYEGNLRGRGEGMGNMGILDSVGLRNSTALVRSVSSPDSRATAVRRNANLAGRPNANANMYSTSVGEDGKGDKDGPGIPPGGVSDAEYAIRLAQPSSNPFPSFALAQSNPIPNSSPPNPNPINALQASLSTPRILYPIYLHLPSSRPSAHPLQSPPITHTPYLSSSVPTIRLQNKIPVPIPE